MAFIPPASSDALRWRPRDSIAAVGLFAATVAVVLWQNAHVAVLWDLSYVLDTATRIAQGQTPYRDFPLAHAPLTFLTHAAIIRLAGRVFFYHALSVAVVGGLGSVLAWRLALRALTGHMKGAWWTALALSAPLAVLGLYCIFPHPSYDCDAIFFVLLALFLLQKLGSRGGKATVGAGLAAGATLVLPLFAKQNIGLAFLAASVVLVALLLVASRLWPERVEAAPRALVAVLAGTFGALALALGILQATVGLGNYLHWTIGFAAQRRMPALAAMAGVYIDPFLCWSLPSMLAGLLLLRGPVARQRWAQTIWTRRAALALVAAPLLFTLASLLLFDNAEERGDALLSLWPLLLALIAFLLLVRMVAFCRARRPLSLAALLPLVALAAIHGTLMSQQLWGSTYALWPLFVYLAAELLGELAERRGAARKGGEQAELALGPELPLWFAPALVSVASLTLAVCGGFYMASEERLSYADLPGGQPRSSLQSALRGLATPGPHLANFDELVDFAEVHIPEEETVVILPGEDPFYFATGRRAQFPVLLFDPATDPYSSAQLVEEARRRQVQWLVVKRVEQLRDDPMPDREASLAALQREFLPVAQLKGYDVYKRGEAKAQGEAMHP
jgi:hypothetical protein